MLTIGSEQPGGFGPDERALVGQLGQVVGHAITAIERKRALTSDDVVELQFRIRGLFDGIDGPSDGTLTCNRTVPTGDDTFLAYGTVSGEAVGTVASLDEQLSHVERATVIDDGAATARFELALADPPVVPEITSRGGRVESTTIAADYELVVHLPRGTDVRDLIATLRDTYPGTEAVSRRRTTRADRPIRRLESVLNEGLTDRQRSVLEAAFYAGFFESPRDSSGAGVAASLGIAPSTFHQHVRVAERKLARALFEAGGRDP